ncbi:hypothetical protein L210DRAFT_3642836 [Boletus edulis BED1]|uniref:DUF6533 domain-containing protein n=1 Tax=Boletus edulis BED1 TaxID=1328754 RepID=A0AAD4C020_BOLED|nr:hypothetical protein L210DRAFT_3642836 [Boletus edulis BED1]
MSSDIQTILELIVLNNYTSLILVTGVVYDYILTFPGEIEYIWCKPWTWVSTMFVVVRYIGLCWIMAIAFLSTSFILGPAEVKFQQTCKHVNSLVSTVSKQAFLSATDLMMILRVYAMWNRSRLILSILLFIYMLQIIAAVVLDGIYNTNTRLSVTIFQVLDFSFCDISYVIGTPLVALQAYRAALRLVLSAALIISAVSQTLKQSFEMYKATKQWQPNRYMQKLLGDGILYFTVNVAFQIYDVLLLVTTQTSITSIFLTTFLYITFYTLIPRFIISIRELYDRDIRGRIHIDTGFGVQLRSNAGPDTIVSAMVFVDGNQALEVEDATNNLGDLETGGVHGSGLNEDYPIGGRE